MVGGEWVDGSICLQAERGAGEEVVVKAGREQRDIE
jgi:hypothetical protein